MIVVAFQFKQLFSAPVWPYHHPKNTIYIINQLQLLDTEYQNRLSSLNSGRNK